MKVIERVHGFIQPLKTSFGTAVTKASATVKKASEIASKILKFIFDSVSYLYNGGKSFIDKMRNSTKNAGTTSTTTASPSFFEKFVFKTLNGFYTLKNSLRYPKKANSQQ